VKRPKLPVAPPHPLPFVATVPTYVPCGDNVGIATVAVPEESVWYGTTATVGPGASTPISASEKIPRWSWLIETENVTEPTVAGMPVALFGGATKVAAGSNNLSATHGTGCAARVHADRTQHSTRTMERANAFIDSSMAERDAGMLAVRSS